MQQKKKNSNVAWAVVKACLLFGWFMYTRLWEIPVNGCLSALEGGGGGGGGESSQEIISC